MIYHLFLLLNCWFGLVDDRHNMVWVGISVVVGNSIGVNGVGDNSLDGLDSVVDMGDEVDHVGNGVVVHVVVWKGVDSVVDMGDKVDHVWSSNLDLGDLVNWSWGLFGHEATSLNILELGMESLLGLGNIGGVIKVHVGNLWGLNVVVDWHQVDMFTGLN